MLVDPLFPVFTSFHAFFPFVMEKDVKMPKKMILTHLTVCEAPFR